MMRDLIVSRTGTSKQVPQLNLCFPCLLAIEVTNYDINMCKGASFIFFVLLHGSVANEGLQNYRVDKLGKKPRCTTAKSVLSIFSSNSFLK